MLYSTVFLRTYKNVHVLVKTYFQLQINTQISVSGAAITQALYLLGLLTSPSCSQCTVTHTYVHTLIQTLIIHNSSSSRQGFYLITSYHNNTGYSAIKVRFSYFFIVSSQLYILLLILTEAGSPFLVLYLPKCKISL